jgi:hypothetical protein
VTVSRHMAVIEEIRAGGHLRYPVRRRDGRTAWRNHAIDVTGMPDDAPSDMLGDVGYSWNFHHIRLREFPVVTDMGEYVLLHELGHVVANHCHQPGLPEHDKEWEADVWTMLRRPQWAQWIAEINRPRIKRMCEDWERYTEGRTRWWRAMCLDVGFTPDFSKGASWYDENTQSNHHLSAMGVADRGRAQAV